MPAEVRPLALNHFTLFVRGLQVEARVGVHMHERGGIQPLIVDLELTVPLPQRDKIAATSDYVEAAAIVRRTAMSQHFELIETFAQHLCDELSRTMRIQKIFVRITKPSALAGWANATGVELRLE